MLFRSKQMREASQQHQDMQQIDWADVDESAAADWLDAANATSLIHGHTHHPVTEPFAGYLGDIQRLRHVTSDWDLDHGKPRAEVLRLSASGFTRIIIR